MGCCQKEGWQGDHSDVHMERLYRAFVRKRVFTHGKGIWPFFRGFLCMWADDLQLSSSGNQITGRTIFHGSQH